MDGWDNDSVATMGKEIPAQEDLPPLLALARLVVEPSERVFELPFPVSVVVDPCFLPAERREEGGTPRALPGEDAADGSQPLDKRFAGELKFQNQFPLGWPTDGSIGQLVFISAPGQLSVPTGVPIQHRPIATRMA